MEMVSPLSTASVKLTVAGETAKSIRHEYEIGGDVEDLNNLIKLIRDRKADQSFRIVPRKYVKNGVVYNSDRPGAILMYSYVRIGFGEVHPNGEYIIKQGDRAGQKVVAYKLVAPELYSIVDNLYKTDRPRFDALSAHIRDNYVLGILGAPDAKFKPAVCDPDTGVLIGVNATLVNDPTPEEGNDSIDGLDDTPNAEDDSNAPF